MIGIKLREAREKKGFSLSDLEKLYGIYKSTIFRYETKGVKPIRRNLVALAKALELPVEHFLQIDSPPPRKPISSLSFEKKLQEILKFTPHERAAIESIIDQILEKHQILRDLSKLTKAYQSPK